MVSVLLKVATGSTSLETKVFFAQQCEAQIATERASFPHTASVSIFNRGLGKIRDSPLSLTAQCLISLQILPENT